MKKEEENNYRFQIKSDIIIVKKNASLYKRRTRGPPNKYQKDEAAKSSVSNYYFSFCKIYRMYFSGFRDIIKNISIRFCNSFLSIRLLQNIFPSKFVRTLASVKLLKGCSSRCSSMYFNNHCDPPKCDYLQII